MTRTTTPRRSKAPDTPPDTPPTAPVPVHTIAVVRGNMDDPGAARKYNDLDTVATLVSRVLPGTTVRRGEHVLLITVPDIPGDPLMAESEVMRYVNFQRAECHADVERAVDQLVARAESADAVRYIGSGLISMYMERMYMKHDEWRDE